MEKLLNDIAYCENIHKVLLDNCNSPCEKIIKSQKNDYSKLHLPEPWNGDIENCKILFISSNPSISSKEKYPDSEWEKAEVKDFFINRFSKEKKWVKNELRPLLKNGDYPSPKNWVRFWAALRSMSKVLLDTKITTAGVDYAMTEIVHCKSQAEIGVADAIETCADKYLDRILKLSNAKVIICLGDKVSKLMKKRYSINNKELVAQFLNEEKLIIFLPHPNARKVKKLEKIIPEEKLSWIKSELKK
jgi:uracil-DNA glycosylase